MFETSGTTDVLEKSSWQKYVLSFVAGCFLMILIFYILLMPMAERAAAKSAEKAAKQKFSLEQAMDPVEAQLVTTKAALQAAIQERDACKAKFDRQTILYDNTIVVDPDKIWIIPADVEPIAVGDRRLTYTHYDPKTKRETVHFHPERQ
jgi:Na+-transporting methylmalonyl-CoA/oxaloacetate decarboxylase gamma subunit